MGLGKTYFGAFTGIYRLLDGSKEAIALADALCGKEFVLVYQGAQHRHACQEALTKWYSSLGPSKEIPGVIYLSTDRTRPDFVLGCRKMPGPAVDYNDGARKQLNARLGVSILHRLAVVDCESLMEMSFA